MSLGRWDWLCLLDMGRICNGKVKTGFCQRRERDGVRRGIELCVGVECGLPGMVGYCWG